MYGQTMIDVAPPPERIEEIKAQTDFYDFYNTALSAPNFDIAKASIDSWKSLAVAKIAGKDMTPAVRQAASAGIDMYIYQPALKDLQLYFSAPAEVSAGIPKWAIWAGIGGLVIFLLGGFKFLKK